MPERLTVERYFALVDEGVLAPDDAVELLEGVIVAMAPQSPRHAAATTRVGEVIRRTIGTRALVREEKPLVLGTQSVPEPDLCVVPHRSDYYADAHPRTALLVVESADSSLVQDRLTKAGIYAAAGIPEYWIVNLRDDCVEVHRRPEPSRRTYSERTIGRRGDSLTLVAFPDATIAVTDLLPAPEPRG
jgi:Uma2 family endonuclease